MVLEALAILALLWWASDLVARRRYGIGVRQRYIVIRRRRRLDRYERRRRASYQRWRDRLANQRVNR